MKAKTSHDPTTWPLRLHPGDDLRRALEQAVSARGLKAAFVLDPAQRRGLVVVTSGPGVDPETYAGRWSAMDRWEEQAITAVVRHAMQPPD